MSSPEFLTRYDPGQLGDALPYVVWAGRYRLYLNLKQAINDSLQVVVASIT